MFTVDKYQQVRCLTLPSHCSFPLYIYLSSKETTYILDSVFPIELSIMISLQIVFFPDERAFALRYQTAGMLETVLRQGVLGEDDTGEESPR